MEIIKTNIPNISKRDSVKVVFIFLFIGLFMGGLFGWLTSFPQLHDFWFQQRQFPGKSDWVFIPSATLKYSAALAIIFVFVLVLSYIVCQRREWLNPLAAPSIRLLAAFIIGLAFFRFESTGPIRYIRVNDFRFIVGPVIMILLVSIALWIHTKRYYGHIVGLMFGTLIVRFLITLIVSTTASDAWPDIIFYSVGEALLAGACGYWLKKAEPDTMHSAI